MPHAVFHGIRHTASFLFHAGNQFGPPLRLAYASLLWLRRSFWRCHCIIVYWCHAGLVGIIGHTPPARLFRRARLLAHPGARILDRRIRATIPTVNADVIHAAWNPRIHHAALRIGHQHLDVSIRVLQVRGHLAQLAMQP